MLSAKTRKAVVKEDENLLPDKTFDLEQLNLLNLAKGLEDTLSAKRPKSVYFKWLGNKKHKLDAEQQDWVLRQIQNAVAISDNLSQLKAKIFLSPEVVSNLIRGYRGEAQRLFELQEKEHINNLSKIDDDMTSRQIIIEAGRLQNLKTQAEINMMNATTQEAKAKADLIMYVVKELDLKNMPQTLQTYLISSIVNPNGSQFNDFDMQEQLKQFVVKEADAKARIAIAKATSDEAQAYADKKTSENTVFNLDSIRNKPKS